MQLRTQYHLPKHNSTKLLTMAGFSSLPSPNPSTTPDPTYGLPPNRSTSDSRNASSDGSPSTSVSPPMPTFSPDSSYFTTPMLSALRAFSTVAVALNVVNQIYDPFYLHTLSPTSLPSFLPPNMHPTPRPTHHTTSPYARHLTLALRPRETNLRSLLAVGDPTTHRKRGGRRQWANEGHYAD